MVSKAGSILHEEHKEAGGNNNGESGKGHIMVATMEEENAKLRKGVEELKRQKVAS